MRIMLGRVGLPEWTEWRLWKPKRPWFESAFVESPGGSYRKESACNAGDLGSIPG